MKTLFLGDISPKEVIHPTIKAKDMETLFSNVSTLFENRDFNFVNLECALTEHDGNIKKFGPPLKAPAETADLLKMLGVHCCGLSNNHVFDYGIKGVEDTLRTLENVGLSYTGFGKNYEDSRKNFVFEKDGEKLCVIAVCEHEYSYALEDRMGSRPYDEYDTMEDIATAKKTCDRVVVIYHGGKEMCQYPSPRLRKLCHAMVKHGADLVLCQHSHCIGCYENFEDGHILYGQGNFLFIADYYQDSPNDAEMWNTCMATLYDTKENKVEFVPIRTGKTGIRLAEGEDREALMAAFDTRNQSLLTNEWKEGWHAFCEKSRERYEKVLRRAFVADATEQQNSMFAHYLDCEAHTDVWRELYPTYNQTNEK